nr:hypothetical protein [Acidovorax sp. JHL-9]
MNWRQFTATSVVCDSQLTNPIAPKGDVLVNDLVELNMAGKPGMKEGSSHGLLKLWCLKTPFCPQLQRPGDVGGTSRLRCNPEPPFSRKLGIAKDFDDRRHLGQLRQPFSCKRQKRNHLPFLDVLLRGAYQEDERWNLVGEKAGDPTRLPGKWNQSRFESQAIRDRGTQNMRRRPNCWYADVQSRDCTTGRLPQVVDAFDA